MADDGLRLNGWCWNGRVENGWCKNALCGNWLAGSGRRDDGRRPIGGANLGMFAMALGCTLRSSHGLCLRERLVKSSAWTMLRCLLALHPSPSGSGYGCCIVVLLCWRRILFVGLVKARLLCLGEFVKFVCLCLGEASASPLRGSAHGCL